MEYEIPGYEIKEVLYKSANNIVCRAINLKTKLEVVIKFNSGNLGLKQKANYSLEKQLIDNLRKSDSDSTIESYGLEEISGHMVLVMQNGGDSLHNYLLRNGPLSLDNFFKIAIKTTELLGHIHHNKIIHKDIKPSNILIDEKNDKFYIIDFNISTLLSREKEFISNTKMLEGSLPYISPEQTGRMNRDIDNRSDIYSLGVTFYELLCGKLPYSGNDALEIIHYHMAKVFPPIIKLRSDIPKMVSDLVDKMIQKDADNRYQTTYSLLNDLKKCRDSYIQSGTIEEFALGDNDKSGRLKIPDRPYGRENEVKTLLNAFDRSAAGELQLLTVIGPSGIGKTTLVHEVHRPIVSKTGLFMSGKFEQFKRDVPYSALKHAFTELSKQLIVFGEKRIEKLQDDIKKEIGDYGRVIVDFVPQLKFLFKELPEIETLSAIESINRFNFNVVKLFKVISKKEHPLVMFIDDLQWADMASMELFNTLIFSGEISTFLFIGAYRDNEMPPVHPFLKLTNEFREKGGKFLEIKVSPLDKMGINEIIRDIIGEKKDLKEQNESFSQLVDLIFQKTLGNPFFIGEFIKFIYREGHFYFDLNSGIWNWNIEKIREDQAADNVLELMVDRLKKFSLQTQKLLNLGSCLGAEFYLKDLLTVSEIDPISIMKDLWEPLSDGLIISGGSDQHILSSIKKDINLNDENELKKMFENEDSLKINISYKFVHDRVQQAASELLNIEEIMDVHLKIARFFRKMNDPSNMSNDELFDLVNHYNMGRGKIYDQAELKDLSNLNFIASKKAIQNLAFNPALIYIKTAQELFFGNQWDEQYEKSISYYLLRIEAEYLNQNFTEAEQVAFYALENVNRNEDRLEIYIRLLSMYSFQGKIKDATDYAVRALSLVGIKENLHCGRLRFAFVFLITAIKLRKYDPEQLLELPAVTDRRMIKILEIVALMGPTAYLYNLELLIVILMRSLILQLKYGVSSDTLFICSGFSAADTYFRFKFKNAIKMVKVCEEISKRFPDNKMRGRFYLAINYPYSRCIYSAEESFKMSYKGHDYSINSGDNTYAATNIASAVYNYALAGTDFEKMYKLSQESHQVCSKLKVYDMEWLSFIMVKTGASFLGLNTPKTFNSLDDRGFVEKEDIEKILNQERRGIRAVCLVLQVQRMLANGDYQDILNYYRKFWDWPLLMVGSLGNFFSVMAIGLSIGKLSEKNSFSYPRKIFYSLSFRFMMWVLGKHSKNNPRNIIAFYHMTKAGFFLFKNKKKKAIELFDKAIMSAKFNKYRYIQGLASEFKGEIYLDDGDFALGQKYLKEAVKYFEEANAKAKVEQLIHRYGIYFTEGELKWNFQEEMIREKEKEKEKEEEMKSNRKKVDNSDKSKTIKNYLNSNTMRTKTRTVLSSNSLSYENIVKFSQEISGEIIFDNLVKKMSDILVGLMRPQKLVFSYPENQDKNKLQMKLLHGDSSYPEEFIKYAYAKGIEIIQEVPFENKKGETFSWETDHYFDNKLIFMIVTFPLICQGKNQGVIYCELGQENKKNWVSNREQLKPLISQIAISLENSILYQGLEEKVKERTQELRIAEKKMIELAHKSGMADVSSKLMNRIGELIPPMKKNKEGFLKIRSGKVAISNLSKTLKIRKAELNREKLLKDDGDLILLIEGAKKIVDEVQKDFTFEVGGFKENIEKITSIVRENKGYVHKKAVKVEVVLSELVAELKEKYPFLFAEKADIFLKTNFDLNTKIMVEKYKYFFAVMAIVGNSVEALMSKKEDYNGTDKKMEIEISVEVIGDLISTRIKDNGPGIDPKVEPEIFKSGMSTKAGGSGMGLHNSYNFINSTGGKIRFENSQSGVTFIIELKQDEINLTDKVKEEEVIKKLVA